LRAAHVQDDIADVTEATRLAAVQRWRPDPEVVHAGDRHAILALRCWAAAGLSDRQIARRMAELTPPADDTAAFAAATAVARHAAVVGLPLHRVVALLASLAAELPASPDADELADIATAAVKEEFPT
jgi:hypothetical protein